MADMAGRSSIRTFDSFVSSKQRHVTCTESELHESDSSRISFCLYNYTTKKSYIYASS